MLEHAFSTGQILRQNSVSNGVDLAMFRGPESPEFL